MGEILEGVFSAWEGLDKDRQGLSFSVADYELTGLQGTVSLL